jgi:hypothetical protein
MDTASPGTASQAPGRADALLLALFGAALLLAATLSFWVQPLVAKLILPILGGSPSVWNTSLVFFQATLLAGYGFAYVANRLLPLRGQALVHLALIALAAFVLPIELRTAPPDPETSPELWVAKTLAITVGAPFFVLTAASPLLQNWFARTEHPAAHDPYFLYVASNVGSMLGLLAYPLALEPLFTLRQQGWLWTSGYALFGVAVAACAIMAMRNPAVVPSATPTPAATAPPGAVWRLRCVALAFIPSALLIGVTGYITTDIAAAPLLWILPLALYLLSFVIAFQRRPLIPHGAAVQLQAFLLIPLVLVMMFQSRDTPLLVLLLHLAAFFATALVCHGELIRLRPPASQLTEFYFLISLGGVIGGAFAALLAPLLFDQVLEYPLCLALAAFLRPGALPRREDVARAVADLAWPAAIAALLAAIVIWDETPPEMDETPLLLLGVFVGLLVFALRQRPVRFGLCVAVILATAVFAPDDEDVLARERNFFGVLKVVETGDPPMHILYHGTTTHGGQSFAPENMLEPLTYYHRDGPVGGFFDVFGGTRNTRRVAVVGLGTGTIACYGRKGEDWTFYEIDPAVEEVARDPDYFTFLRDCPAKVVLGDARLSLAHVPDSSLGLVILDAFSSDAIPIHLLTEQALRLYLSKLGPDGVMLIHISNRYIDLAPVLGNLAHTIGLAGALRRDEEDKDANRYGSDWVVLARRPDLLAQLKRDTRWAELPQSRSIGVWRDDHANLIGALLSK